MNTTLEAPITHSPSLFDALKIRDIAFRNRIAVSPMCMYSAEDGLPNHWHMVHLGSRAVGGAGLVIAEATAVVPNGRISIGDTGIWNDEQVEAWKPITQFIKDQGAVPGIQLAHAGRKAGFDLPWGEYKLLSPQTWDIVGPSSIKFADNYAQPRELTVDDIKATVQAFADAAIRAYKAGFEVVEIHGAHGYLINSFLSPLSNHRTDEYGGSFENRSRIVREIVVAVRNVWPEGNPLLMRFSATDWVEGGWTIEDSVELAKMIKPLGVDLIDASSGGNAAKAEIPSGPGYQVFLANQIRNDAQILTGAVGMITEASQAQEILNEGSADMIFLARELLRDPYWPRRAASELGKEIHAPKQYGRAW